MSCPPFAAPSTSISHSPQGFNYYLPSPLISMGRLLLFNDNTRTWAKNKANKTQTTVTSKHTHTSALLHSPALTWSMLSLVNTPAGLQPERKAALINTTSFPSLIFIIFCQILSVIPISEQHIARLMVLISWQWCFTFLFNADKVAAKWGKTAAMTHFVLSFAEFSQFHFSRVFSMPITSLLWTNKNFKI